MNRQVLLLILDGWGIGSNDYSNPIYVAQPKNFNFIRSRYLSGALQASGIAVGLPWDEEGNSEVGHLNMGAGRIVYQDYPKITLSIRNGSFSKNPVLDSLTKHIKKNNSSLHLIGILSDRNVHASMEHLQALIKTAKERNWNKLYLHLISDGKDSPPRSVLSLLEKLEPYLAETKIGKISSLSGRYYAMDQDQHWDRTQRAYSALVGDNLPASDWELKVKGAYEHGLTDEFIEPFLINPPDPIKDGDAIIFFNFRGDAISQLVGAFALADFNRFPIHKFRNLLVVTMTSYSQKIKAPVLFQEETLDEPLGKVISAAGKLQLRIAESKKYAPLTYFFNGYLEKPFQGEYRILVPSKTTARTEEAPEMMTREITNRTIEALAGGGFDFILTNFASPDIIAHTGNYDAALQAIKVVDEEIDRLAKTCREKDVTFIITADHGNIERMIDPYTGRIETHHDMSLVPFYLVGKDYERPKIESEIKVIENEAIGILSDIAPTILELLDIPKPESMTSQSILKSLK